MCNIHLTTKHALPHDVSQNVPIIYRIVCLSICLQHANISETKQDKRTVTRKLE